MLREHVEESNILADKASGKNLDRLSRNKEDIKKELQWFKERKV